MFFDFFFLQSRLFEGQVQNTNLHICELHTIKRFMKYFKNSVKKNSLVLNKSLSKSVIDRPMKNIFQKFSQNKIQT